MVYYGTCLSHACSSIVDLPSGHMMGAYNIPYGNFLRSDTKTMKSAEELKIGTETSFIHLMHEYRSVFFEWSSILY